MIVYLLVGGNDYSHTDVIGVYDDLGRAIADGEARYAVRFVRDARIDGRREGVPNDGERPQGYDYVWIQGREVIGA